MKRIYLLLIFMIAWLPLWAQVSVSIQILPPYPTKITDYASQPQLMVIGVTNTSTTQQRIQLRGTVTGDNGIQLRVRDTYKSPQPIVLEPGQIRMLNGGDLKYFFDYTRIDYKGITQQDFINKNGLPEGTYRFCIRAYNYDSNAPISPDEPVGCSNTFTISSLEPPTIISPRPEQGIASNTGQTVLMQWSTPPGAAQRVMSGVRYHIRMVEIRDNRNPNSAIQSQPYFFDREVMGNSYVFGPADPKLTPGRKYAFLVEASDPMNHTPFRNMGRSEVRTFTYLPSETSSIPPVLANKSTQLPAIATNVSPVCDCHTDAPTSSIANSKVNTTTNKVVWVGGFKMEVQTIDAPSVNNGPISGTGVIGLPFVSQNPVPGAKLRVKFSNINVTEDGKMKDGQVEGIVNNAAASFIPTADNPAIPTLELPHDKAQGLEDYFKTHANQMLSAIKQSGNGAGFELPLGLSKGPVTVAMTHIYFNATQAWFEAAAAMDVPDGNPADQSNILGFTGRNLCINTVDNFCKEGELVLSNDFKIPVVGLTLKKQGQDRAGTSITFNKSGFQKLHIDADYIFPDNSLIDYTSNQSLTARISTDSEPGSPNAWSDWMVAVKVNPFYVKGMRSIKFDLGGGSIFFDHSDYRNPQNMPASFTSGDAGDAPINTTDKTWTGVYIPQINAYLPQIIKNTQSGDGLVKITASNLLFDSNGFTGKIENTGPTPPLTIGNGSLDGWHASIDKVSLQFFRSAFKKSTMSGKVVLPASNMAQASNQLDYNATLTTPGGNLAYSFNIHTKDNVSFDALYARVNLYDSQIEVHGDGSNPPSASATLNGSLSVANDPLAAVKIPGLGKLSLPHIAFTNLKLLTTAPFLDASAFHAELTSANDPQGGGSPGMKGFDYIPDQDNLSGPNAGDLNNTATVDNSTAFDGGDGTQQQSIAGFKFTAGYSGFKLMPNPVTGEYKIGLGFNGGLELGMGPVTVAAKAAFTLTSGIKKNGDFITWAGVGGKIDSIDFAGGADLGPFKIKGYVRYYNKPDDEGFVGALETDIASLVSVTMRAQFGNKKDSQGGFTYFNFDALADFGQTGITLAPPIPLAIYGFGGGIYFNMKQVSSLPNAANFPVAPRTQDVDTPPSTAKTSGDPKPNDSLENLLKSPSGMQLTPSRDTMGVSATILFGLTSRNTLDADATLSVELNKNTGGLGRITINSHARVLTDISRALSDRNKYSTGVGSLFIDMAPVDHSFTAHMDLELGVPFAKDSTLLHARGGGDFSWSPAGWYLRFGRPEGSGGQPNKVTLFSILTGKSYFEVGSKVDDMPPIPSDVAELVGHGPRDQADKLQRPTPAARNGYHAGGSAKSDHGLIFGSSIEVGDKDKEYHFLMFFGKLNAKMGFDFSIKSGVQCTGNASVGGPGGWYAQGDAYFGARAALGIEINLFLIHGKFTIFDAGAAAMVRAGLPDPVWVQGAIGGHFAILNGAISSDFSFGFNIGKECKDPTTDAFGGLELIADITPADKLTAKQPLTTMPGVIFNIKPGSRFKNDYSNWDGVFEFDDYTKANDKGLPRTRYFKFDKSCLSINLNGSDVKNDLIRLNDGFTLAYQPDGYLQKNTQYNFRVDAKMHEGIVLPGSTTPIYYDNVFVRQDGKDAVQSKETTFTTDSGFAAIPATEYAITSPLHSDKSVMTDLYTANNNEMSIETKKVIDNGSFFKYPEGTTYTARIFRNDVKDGADRPVTMATVSKQPNMYKIAMSAPHSKWSFRGPQLQPNSAYTVLIIAKMPTENNNNAPADANNKAVGINSKVITKTYNAEALGQVKTDAFTVKALGNTFNGGLNRLAGGENIVGGFNFHTSAYTTYQDKIAALKISKIYNTDKRSTVQPSNSKPVNNAIFRLWYPDSTRYTLRFGSSLKGFNFPVDITLTGEQFSRADMSNFTSDDIFQPDYNGYPGMRTHVNFNPLFKGEIHPSYGDNFIDIRSFLANNTGIALTNIRTEYSSPGQAKDSGVIYCDISGGQDDEYVGTNTSIGAAVPTQLPQANTNLGTMNIGSTVIGNMVGSLPGMANTIQKPVILSQMSGQVLVCKTRGQMTFTDAVQRQVDKLKNWAVNPGDNVMTNINNPGEQVTSQNPGAQNMGNISMWENVSTVTSSYLNGGITVNKLEGAVQGAMNQAGKLK